MNERSIPVSVAVDPGGRQRPSQPKPQGAEAPLPPEARRALRAAAALVVPASAEYGVPGADDEAIAEDIERTAGRDRAEVLLALAKLEAAAGGPLAEQPPQAREAAGRWLRENEPALAATFAALVYACYYRDDRVMRSLGLEPRAPHPQGYSVHEGDWSLLEPVRARGRLWRPA
ncbi:MAG: hypothetical protein JNL85_02920 [Rubrivivax sp.]|nr:hypothetical protein [Rubrivivax sp.]